MKHPGLKKHYNLKSRQDALENDYIDKLSESEKDWLNSFNEEYVNANFKHGGKILHNTKMLKKTCFDANNARNRDVYNRAKSSGKLDSIELFHDRDKTKEEHEIEATVVKKPKKRL